MNQSDDNLRRSFASVRNDIKTLNDWVSALHKNQEFLPKRIEDIAAKIVESVERNVVSMERIFRNLLAENKRQIEKIKALESKLEDISKEMAKLKPKDILIPHHVEKLEASTATKQVRSDHRDYSKSPESIKSQIERL